MATYEIKGVDRFQYQPGDRFVIHIEKQVDQAEAEDVVHRFVTLMKLPPGTPVVIFSAGMRLEIVGPHDV